MPVVTFMVKLPRIPLKTTTPEVLLIEPTLPIPSLRERVGTAATWGAAKNREHPVQAARTKRLVNFNIGTSLFEYLVKSTAISNRIRMRNDITVSNGHTTIRAAGATDTSLVIYSLLQ